jgi:hypothetical protein
MLLGGGPGPATTTTTTTLDELLRMSTPGTGTASLGGGRVDLDPTVFLRTRSGEALQITDFIAFREAEQQEIELKEGVFIRLASGKPKLDTVSPAQFLAANSRIMAKLIETGRLSGQGIIDYLAYTAKVGEMACRYTWSSVLAYDQQYRVSQAAYGFRWGSDSQHLAMVALRERQPTTNQPPHQRHQSRPTGTRLPRTVGPSGKEVCVQWNRGHCSFAQRCQYEHCCSICLQPSHPATSHPSAAVTTTSNGGSNSSA